jgi:hypothetical protein
VKQGRKVMGLEGHKVYDSAGVKLQTAVSSSPDCRIKYSRYMLSYFILVPFSDLIKKELKWINLYRIEYGFLSGLYATSAINWYNNTDRHFQIFFF